MHFYKLAKVNLWKIASRWNTVFPGIDTLAIYLNMDFRQGRSFKRDTCSKINKDRKDPKNSKDFVGRIRKTRDMFKVLEIFMQDYLKVNYFFYQTLYLIDLDFYIILFYAFFMKIYSIS